jgi:hypothetical protein
MRELSNVLTPPVSADDVPDDDAAASSSDGAAASSSDGAAASAGDAAAASTPRPRASKRGSGDSSYQTPIKVPYQDLDATLSVSDDDEFYSLNSSPLSMGTATSRKRYTRKVRRIV